MMAEAEKFGNYIRESTDVDAPNELEQAQIQQTLIGCGVLTVNEVRRMRGLAPLLEKNSGVWELYT